MKHTIPIFVFAKPPRIGVSKTRLAEGVGPRLAVALAQSFLADTWHTLSQVRWGRPVLATTEVEADFGVAMSERVDQGGGDLGDRLQRVLSSGVRASGSAFAVGADSPGLPIQMLDAAHEALREVDAVFVPTEDGGFCVLGLRRCPAGLFFDLPWSTPGTLSALERRLQEREMSARRIDAWFDIDEARDLDRFRERVPRDAAKATWAVLDAAKPEASE